MKQKIVMQQFLGYTGNRSFSKNQWDDGTIDYIEVTMHFDGMATVRSLENEPYIATPMLGDPVYPQDMENTK